MPEEGVLEREKQTSASGIITAIILTALVVGGVMYMLQSAHQKFAEQSFQQQITLLQNQITLLQPAQQAQNQQVTQQPINQDYDVHTGVVQNEQGNPRVTDKQKIIYSNAKYGFSMTFPQAWKGYIAKSRTVYDGSSTSDSISFGFAAQESVFSISIHTQKQWEQITSEEGPKPTYLGENSQYVFGYTTAQDALDNTIIARMREIQDIIKTFTITQ